jgi:alkylation response protein AidB-like acyl-CoA dehydrogenase
MHHRSLRYCDTDLDADQQAVVDLVDGFLAEYATVEVVRRASNGFDKDLWHRFAQLGLLSMSLPASADGDGRGLVEICLVAERCGRYLAPIPFAEAVVGARLAAATGLVDVVIELLEHNAVPAVAPRAAAGGRVLVPAGAVASTVFAMRDGQLIRGTRRRPPPALRNLGDAPLAWWSLDPATFNTYQVVATGDAAEQAMAQAWREWKLVTAALLAGLTAGALDRAVSYARSRHAFGVPIGYFQSVAHPLVDTVIALQGLEALVRKAAWFEDHEPGRRPELVDMAFVHASETANDAAARAVHTLGGVGITVEADVHLFFRRAKGWALQAGTVAGSLASIADDVLNASVWR